MIIDAHCHYTTEPPALHQFRDRQLAGLADAARKPASTDLAISQPPEDLRTQRTPGLSATRRAAGEARHAPGARLNTDAPAAAQIDSPSPAC
jgi:4-oxalmesaconate hydratase